LWGTKGEQTEEIKDKKTSGKNFLRVGGGGVIGGKKLLLGDKGELRRLGCGARRGLEKRLAGGGGNMWWGVEKVAFELKN